MPRLRCCPPFVNLATYADGACVYVKNDSATISYSACLPSHPRHPRHLASFLSCLSLLRLTDSAPWKQILIVRFGRLHVTACLGLRSEEILWYGSLLDRWREEGPFGAQKSVNERQSGVFTSPRNDGRSYGLCWQQIQIELQLVELPLIHLCSLSLYTSCNIRFHTPVLVICECIIEHVRLAPQTKGTEWGPTARQPHLAANANCLGAK